MIWLLIGALCVAIPTAYLGGHLRGEALAYGAHSPREDRERYAVPTASLVYNLSTGRHEPVERGRHRSDRDDTRWLRLAPPRPRSEVFPGTPMPGTVETTGQMDALTEDTSGAIAAEFVSTLAD